MNFFSKRVGEFEYDENKIIEFPQGIPGFDDFKKFVILIKENLPYFLILHSIENENLMFILTDPFLFLKDYSFELSDEELEFLELNKNSKLGKDFIVLSIVTVRQEVKNFSLNLKAPIIINLKKKIAKQVILYDYDFPIRYHINFKNKEIKQYKKIDFPVKIA